LNSRALKKPKKGHLIDNDAIRLKNEIDQYKSKINNLVKNKANAKKAAFIISEMLNNKK